MTMTMTTPTMNGGDPVAYAMAQTQTSDEQQQRPLSATPRPHRQREQMTTDQRLEYLSSVMEEYGERCPARIRAEFHSIVYTTRVDHDDDE